MCKWNVPFVRRDRTHDVSVANPVFSSSVFSSFATDSCASQLRSDKRDKTSRSTLQSSSSFLHRLSSPVETCIPHSNAYCGIQESSRDPVMFAFLRGDPGEPVPYHRRIIHDHLLHRHHGTAPAYLGSPL